MIERNPMDRPIQRSSTIIGVALPCVIPPASVAVALPAAVREPKSIIIGLGESAPAPVQTAVVRAAKLAAAAAINLGEWLEDPEAAEKENFTKTKASARFALLRSFAKSALKTLDTPEFLMHAVANDLDKSYRGGELRFAENKIITEIYKKLVVAIPVMAKLGKSYADFFEALERIMEGYGIKNSAFDSAVISTKAAIGGHLAVGNHITAHRIAESFLERCQKTVDAKFPRSHGKVPVLIDEIALPT